ncbi:formylglycine-generating enzyme family protein [Pendulispora albinea]|uniref:Formylglycine-generating enzyme family protein n=2 Tax=Pendulispora albinea TaxID=2741071 RepID=A0ABZ2MCM9_9BACT
MGTADPLAPPNERPPHHETVAPFWIDKTEVTVEAYRACVNRHMCARPSSRSAQCTFDLDDPNLPISCVTWKDADTYCRAVGKRLPREAEWEFAARGNFSVRYPWGGGWTYCALAATLVRESSSRTCTGQRPARVGTHPSGSSTFGVLDLTGNVEEWTADWYAEHVAEGASPRSGASHVLRGGGWLSSPLASRATSRNWGSSMEAGPNVGFRCAKD